MLGYFHFHKMTTLRSGSMRILGYFHFQHIAGQDTWILSLSQDGDGAMICFEEDAGISSLPKDDGDGAMSVSCPDPRPLILWGRRSRRDRERWRPWRGSKPCRAWVAGRESVAPPPVAGSPPVMRWARGWPLLWWCVHCRGWMAGPRDARSSRLGRKRNVEVRYRR